MSSLKNAAFLSHKPIRRDSNVLSLSRGMHTVLVLFSAAATDLPHLESRNRSSINMFSQLTEVDQAKRAAPIHDPTGFAQNHFDSRTPYFGVKSTALLFLLLSHPHQVYAPLRASVGQRHRYPRLKPSRAQRWSTFLVRRFEDPADGEEHAPACAFARSMKKTCNEMRCVYPLSSDPL